MRSFKSCAASLALCAVAVATQTLARGAAPPAQGELCGSVERFTQTKRWQDLPGCPVEFDEAGGARRILNSLKFKYKAFFEDWDAKVDDNDYLSDVAGSFKSLRPGFHHADEWKSDPELVAARPAYEEMFRAVEQRVKWAEILRAESFNSNFEGALQFIKRNEHPDRLRNYLENGVAPTLKKLEAAGAPPTLVVGRERDGRAYTISEIKALMPALRATEGEMTSRAKAEEEAKWRAYTSVLKGDRLSIFNRYHRQGILLAGVGGRTLETPADFQRTPIMVKLAVDDNGLVSRWTLTVWRFRGDRLVDTQTKSGWGKDAPSSAYR